MSLADIDEVSSTLLTNDAWMMLDKEGGSNKFGTGPIRDTFLALGHSRLSKDLNNLNGFISVWNYPQSSYSNSAEWGAVNNVRFFLSSQGSVSANASGLGNNVYNVFIQGQEALGCVYQDNFSAQFLYRPREFSDPLFQNITLGVTFAEVPRILNDLWIINMRTTLR
jgi:N4-gp56 family major capsid protein